MHGNRRPIWMPSLLVPALLVCLSSVVGAQQNPTAEGVLVGCPDPTTIQSRRDGRYYIFATGRGVSSWRSDDLLHWKRIGRVFDRSMPAWAQAAVPKARGIWAPDVAFFSGRYHLYYSVSSFGSQRSVIGLAVNRALDPAAEDYRWEDRGLVIESSPEQTDFNAIDPALFVDQGGQPYLFWGSYWTGLKATRIDSATGKPAQDEQKIVAVAARAAGTDPPAIEAPYVIFRDYYYYLFVSWDFCCAGVDSTYKIMVGRSRSVLGPYVDLQGRLMTEGGGSLVVASCRRWRGPGHNSVLHTERGDWLVHHAYDAKNVSLHRVLQIRPMYWIDGWPVAGKPLTQPIDDFGKQRNRRSHLGKWHHGVDYVRSTPIELAKDGAARGPGTNGTWQRDGSTLTLKWTSEKAPDGVWTDRVVIEPDGTSYVGRNQNGQVIHGTTAPIL